MWSVGAHAQYSWLLMVQLPRSLALVDPRCWCLSICYSCPSFFSFSLLHTLFASMTVGWPRVGALRPHTSLPKGQGQGIGLDVTLQVIGTLGGSGAYLAVAKPDYPA